MASRTRITSHTTTVQRVDEEWRNLRDGTRKRKFVIYLDDPVRQPGPNGVTMILLPVVETWDAWAASLCLRAVTSHAAIRFRVRSTPWGLDLVNVSPEDAPGESYAEQPD
jgi:hypothetical protein